MPGRVEQGEPRRPHVTAFGRADHPAPADGDHVLREPNQVVVGGEKDGECPEPEGLEARLGGGAQDVVGQRPLATSDDERRVRRRHVATESYGTGRHGSEPVAWAEAAVGLPSPLVGG